MSISNENLKKQILLKLKSIDNNLNLKKNNQLLKTKTINYRKNIFVTSININDITDEEIYTIQKSGELVFNDEINLSDINNNRIYEIEYNNKLKPEDDINKLEPEKQTIFNNNRFNNNRMINFNNKRMIKWGGNIDFVDNSPYNEMEEITGLYQCNTIRFYDCDVMYPFNLNFSKITEYFSNRLIVNQTNNDVLQHFNNFVNKFLNDVNNPDNYLDEIFSTIENSVNHFKQQEQTELSSSNIYSIPSCDSENNLFEYSNLVIRFLSEKGNFIQFLSVIIASDKHIKKIANRYYLHNNGFDKIVLANIGKCKLRLHIWWSNTSEEFAEQPHDHRWSFASCNVSGSFRTQIFEELYEPFGKIPGIDKKKIYDMGRSLEINKDGEGTIIHNPSSYTWNLGDTKPFYKYVYTSPTDLGRGNGTYRNIASGLYNENENPEYKNVCFLQVIEDTIFKEGQSYIYPKRKIHSIVKDNASQHCVTLVLTLPPSTKHNRLYTAKKFKLYKNISVGTSESVLIIENLKGRMSELVFHLQNNTNNLNLPQELNIDLPSDT